MQGEPPVIQPIPKCKLIYCDQGAPNGGVPRLGDHPHPGHRDLGVRHVRATFDVPAKDVTTVPVHNI